MKDEGEMYDRLHNSVKIKSNEVKYYTNKEKKYNNKIWKWNSYYFFYLTTVKGSKLYLKLY